MIGMIGFIIYEFIELDILPREGVVVKEGHCSFRCSVLVYFT